MERGRFQIENGFISFFSLSGNEQQTITFAPVQVAPRERPIFLSLLSYFSLFGRRIYFYEAISKLKRSIRAEKKKW